MTWQPWLGRFSVARLFVRVISCNRIFVAIVLVLVPLAAALATFLALLLGCIGYRDTGKRGEGDEAETF